MTKQKFIGKYLDKNMSHKGLPKGLSMEYYSRLEKEKKKAKTYS